MRDGKSTDLIAVRFSRNRPSCGKSIKCLLSRRNHYPARLTSQQLIPVFKKNGDKSLLVLS